MSLDFAFGWVSISVEPIQTFRDHPSSLETTFRSVRRNCKGRPPLQQASVTRGPWWPRPWAHSGMESRLLWPAHPGLCQQPAAHSLMQVSHTCEQEQPAKLRSSSTQPSARRSSTVSDDSPRSDSTKWQSPKRRLAVSFSPLCVREQKAETRHPDSNSSSSNLDPFQSPSKHIHRALWQDTQTNAPTMSMLLQSPGLHDRQHRKAWL